MSTNNTNEDKAIVVEGLSKIYNESKPEIAVRAVDGVRELHAEESSSWRRTSVPDRGATPQAMLEVSSRIRDEEQGAKDQ